MAPNQNGKLSIVKSGVPPPTMVTFQWDIQPQPNGGYRGRIIGAIPAGVVALAQFEFANREIGEAMAMMIIKQLRALGPEIVNPAGAAVHSGTPIAAPAPGKTIQDGGAPSENAAPAPETPEKDGEENK